MAHNLMAGGAHLVWVGAKPWHGLGLEIAASEAITVTEAMERARANYLVHKCPNTTLLPDGTTTDPRSYTLMREPMETSDQWQPIGGCSADYVVIQNHELATMFDKVELTKQCPLSTFGVLGRGEMVFASFDAGNFKVLDEECRWWLGLIDDKSGSHALRFTLGVVRQVCENTVRLNTATAAVTASIPHVGDAMAEAEWRIQLMQQLVEGQRRGEEAMNHMGATKVTEKTAAKIITQVYPDVKRPRKVEFATALHMQQMGGTTITGYTPEAFEKIIGDHEYQQGLVTRDREGALAHYAKINDEYPAIAKTGWALLNGVTGYEDHDRRKNSTSLTTLIGDSAVRKSKAFDLIAALN